MNTLLANPAFDTALTALVVALAAFIQQRVGQARQGAQIESVQKQHEQAPAAQPTIVTVPPASPGPLLAASVRCPQCGGQVHLDSLSPAGPTAASPLDLP